MSWHKYDLMSNLPYIDREKSAVYRPHLEKDSASTLDSSYSFDQDCNDLD